MTTTGTRSSRLSGSVSTRPTPAARTRRLLGCGMIAGPLYLAVAAAQAVLRDGFDPTKHAASLLTLGDHGWIQIANFVITGAFVIAGAVGLRQTGAFGSRWAPRLLALYGVGTICAGIFVPDPALGFPVGTPDGQPTTISWHGMLHFAAGGVGFLGLIICCIVLARRFHSTGHPARAAYSFATGIIFLAAFAGLASGSAGETTTLAFYAAITAAFTWLTTTLHHALRS